MRGVQRGGPEHARVHVRPPGANAQVEVDHPPHADREARLPAPDHRAVEDQRDGGRPLVLVDPVDDRAAADLLLAVEREADVDRQRALVGELPRRLDEHEHVPLVVGDPAGVELAVAPGQLERRRLPELERVGRLHVEVRVRQRIVCAESGLVDAGISPMTSGLAPHGTSSAVPPPSRMRAAIQVAAVVDVSRMRGVRADGRDRDELGELRDERF